VAAHAPAHRGSLEGIRRGEIRAIEDRRLAADEDLIEAELGCGRHAELLPDLEQLVEGRAQ
jgi:hypothetical protein